MVSKKIEYFINYGQRIEKIEFFCKFESPVVPYDFQLPQNSFVEAVILNNFAEGSIEKYPTVGKIKLKQIFSKPYKTRKAIKKNCDVVGTN